MNVKTPLNIPTTMGLLTVANPLIHAWVEDSVLWTLKRKCRLLTARSFAATSARHDPNILLFGPSYMRSEEMLKHARINEQRLSEAAENMLPIEDISDREIGRAELLMDVDLEYAWHRHCRRYPHTDKVDYPVEFHNFEISLTDIPQSDYLEVRAAALPRVKRHRDTLAKNAKNAYIDSTIWDVQIPGLKLNLPDPWWRKAPKDRHDRFSEGSLGGEP